MDLARTTAITELDAPRASTSRDVAAYLSIVTREQDRYLDALATATALLADGAGGLPAAAATHVRLTQQFMDARRSILRSWADTDAKVERIAETTILEAAMLGLDVDGRIDMAVAADSAAEHELRRLLDRWWQLARADSVAAIETAQADASNWLEVARLAGTDETDDDETDDDEPDADETDDETADDETGAGETMLPGEVSGLFAALAGSPIGGLLDELAALLSDPEPAAADLGPSPVLPKTDAVPAAAIVLAPDGFDRFWTSNRPVDAGLTQRHRVLDAVVPMLLVVLLLVPVLLLIG